MEFQRSPRQTLMVLINLFVVAGVAAWCLSDAWFGGGGLNWILGGVFGVWGAFILQSFLRRRVFIRLERHGVLINTAIRPVRFEFEDLVWANLDEGTRICFFRLRRPHHWQNPLHGNFPKTTWGAGRRASAHSRLQCPPRFAGQRPKRHGQRNTRSLSDGF